MCMKTQPVNNTNFKAIYIRDESYSADQRYAIKHIRKTLDNDTLKELKSRGYDIFIEGTPKGNKMVSVSAIKNFNFTDNYAVKTCRKIPIKDYFVSFDVNDINEKIDKFERDERRSNTFCKIVFGLIVGSVLALTAAYGIKVSKSSKNTVNPKAATELVDTIQSKIK